MVSFIGILWFLKSRQRERKKGDHSVPLITPLRDPFADRAKLRFHSVLEICFQHHAVAGFPVAHVL